MPRFFRMWECLPVLIPLRDQACADACLEAVPIANSQLGEHLARPDWKCYHDHFKDSNPNIEWQATLDQGEKIGLGTRDYILKRV